MKFIKWFLAAVVLTALIIVGATSFNYYQDTYVGKDYFTKITQSVDPKEEVADDGTKIGEIYEYSVTGYSADNDKCDLIIPWRGENKIPKGAWVKVNASKKRVISEEIVNAKDVPKNVKSQFD